MRLENVAGPSPIPTALHTNRDRRTARSGKAEPVENNSDASGCETADTPSKEREMRVKALRDAIRNGTYHPDPREVARKLLERGF